MEIPAHDENGDPIPVEELPGFLGHIWDRKYF